MTYGLGAQAVITPYTPGSIVSNLRFMDGLGMWNIFAGLGPLNPVMGGALLVQPDKVTLPYVVGYLSVPVGLYILYRTVSK